MTIADSIAATFPASRCRPLGLGQDDLGGMPGRGVPEIGDEGHAEDELEEGRVERDPGAGAGANASGRAFAKAMTEIAQQQDDVDRSRRATATATVASSVPRHRIAITTANSARPRSRPTRRSRPPASTRSR